MASFYYKQFPKLNRYSSLTILKLMIKGSEHIRRKYVFRQINTPFM